MTTKLVICDIDATLVNEKKELTPRTKKDLIQLHEKGIYFGIASGRPADELKRNKEYWDLPFDFDFVLWCHRSQDQFHDEKGMAKRNHGNHESCQM